MKIYTFKNKETKIIVEFDAGFSNNLYIRGNLLGLNWEKGVLLKNLNSNTWEWSTRRKFKHILEFKILLNDSLFETGENHLLNYGEKVKLFPKF